MTNTPFSELQLTPKVEKAINEMGFDLATPIQSEAIPLIRTGVDVIARSQTGTGKTVAFGIPAIEIIDTHEEKPTIQVLIICPTRELAQQAGEEIRKLARFKTGIRPVDVYGGTDMDRQFTGLRRANIVIGTPGRIMDHMSRKTMKLANLKMIILDEADEMLKMGFKEDIETILAETPENRQTVLFSATMPPEIMALARKFQHDPQIIEINKSQVTLENIDQSYVEVPPKSKCDALHLLLRYHRPNRALIFCNTKSMVDELTENLNRGHFAAEGLHGDMKQSQRTTVMNRFKQGKIGILVATDVAARGIDVSDIDYVINYDIPTKTEYYVHRIGRTGRAGKSGQSITICCGKRQAMSMRALAREVKSEIRCEKLPTAADIQEIDRAKSLQTVTEALGAPIQEHFFAMADELVAQGHDLRELAAVALQLHFARKEVAIPRIELPERHENSLRDRRREDRPKVNKRVQNNGYADILIDIGSMSGAAPNHIVGALTERTSLIGKEIGKVDIYNDQSVAAIPADRVTEVVEAMRGCKICGKPTVTLPLADPLPRRKNTFGHSGGKDWKHRDGKKSAPTFHKRNID